MNCYQLLFMTVFVGVFTCLASACAAQTIKFRSVVLLAYTVGWLIFVAGFSYTVFTKLEFNYLTELFILFQVILAIISFIRGWKDKNYTDPEPTKPDPYDDEDDFDTD